MKWFRVFYVVALLSLLAITAHAAQPDLKLERNIAYQQGQFAALYDRCGSTKDRVVIGGSAINWRAEILTGYKGSTAERQQLEQAFDTAIQDVAADQSACEEWVKQAAATWHSIERLVKFGMPVIFKQ